MNEDIPEDYIKRVTSTVPFGYELSEHQGYLKPIKKEINSLRLATGMIVNEEISLQMASDWLQFNTGRKISAKGLQKHVDKLYGTRKERLGVESA